MGSWDCYCALCAGPLSIWYARFGSKKKRSLEKRRAQVELERRRRKVKLDLKKNPTGRERYVKELAEIEGTEADEDDEDDDEDDDEMEDIPDEGVHSDWGEPGDEDDDDYEISSTSSYSSDYSDSIESTDLGMHAGVIQDVPVPPPEPEPEVEVDDTWSQASDLSLNGRDPLQRAVTWSNDEGSDNYDPTVLTREDINWLDRCRCLAINSVAIETKAFISGRGRYDDFGSFTVQKPGKDPNDTGNIYHSCFHSYDVKEPYAIPFHEACFNILAKSLGYQDVREVDKDVMYAVMNQCLEEHGSKLNIDYGLARDLKEYWETMSGEEYIVCDPGPKPSVEDLLRSMMPARLFGGASAPLELSPKVRNDPLRVLPYDILHDIVDYLSIDDTMSLMTASWHVLSSTRKTSLWKHMLRHRIAGWLWEWNSILHDTIIDDFDYKGAFLWLERLTRPEFGMTGPMMGIANRRRIWTTVQELVPLYHEKHSRDLPPALDLEEAEAIFDSAMSLHVPIVKYPGPKNDRTSSTQFICSWHEITHRSANLDTYWNTDGALVGISVTFGSSERVFGSTDGYAGRPLHIDANDWIKEIIVDLSPVDMFNEKQDRSLWKTVSDMESAEDAWIGGMRIKLKSGQKKILKSMYLNTQNKRAFIILPGMHLIGLTGQIAASGVISRLGLLQAFRPGEEPPTPPSYTPAQQRLWPFWSSIHGVAPIWEHPNYQLYTFPSSDPPRIPPPGSIPLDMIPHQILLWAERPDLRQYLDRISIFQVAPNTTSSKNVDIIGIWARKTFDKRKNTAQHFRPVHVGTTGPVPIQHPDFQSISASTKLAELYVKERFYPFEEAHMRHFDIDGPGGEVVAEVHVSDDVRAIKLVTNRGRECCWGDEGGDVDVDRWRVKRAGEGECIVGLSCCFGEMSGWSESAKTMSHWKLSDVGVVMMRVEG